MKNLHDAILNLPCKIPHYNQDIALGYMEGHRDALLAAAELCAGATSYVEELCVKNAALQKANEDLQYESLLYCR